MYKYFIQLCSKNYHLFFKKGTLLCLLFNVFFITNCGLFSGTNKGTEVYFEGPAQQNVMLYKVEKDSSAEKYTSLYALATESKHTINTGTYLIANECTSYQFEIKENEKQPLHIRLNTFQIKFDNAPLTNRNENVDVQCFNKITGEKTDFKNISTFYILPGKNIMTISGINVRFEASENETKNFFVHLVPFKLISQIENDQTQFFIQPAQVNSTNPNAQNILQDGTVNELVWLHPGKYDVEVNGTKQAVTIEANQPTNIELSRIRILQPKTFLQVRAKASGQPIFAYINKKVLFSLDKDYVVFPGHYSISLDNSEMEQNVNISAGSSLKIQTYGAQINPPSCPEADKQQSCSYLQKAFIHYKDQPFVIAKVPLGVPFLVFQGEYEYGVEGMDGIVKALPISADTIKEEQIGKIKLKWKIQTASGNLETKKIYIEPGCCGLSGKSDDLNSYRPRELLLPEGEYNLSYFVRHDKGPLKKNGVSTRVSSEHINEVQIPIYANNNQNINAFVEDDDNDKPQAPSSLAPVSP